MFFVKDAGRKRLYRVIIEPLNFFLQDHRPVVEQLINIMHGAARRSYTGIKRLFLCVKARECGQKARVYVHDPARKTPHEFRRQKPHIAGKTHEVHAVIFKRISDLRVVFGTRPAFSLNNQRLNAVSRSLLKPRGLRLIAYNDRNLARRYLTALDRIDDRRHIRPPTRY